MNDRLLPAAALACLLVLAARPAAAQDDPNPYYLGAMVATGRDSNVFRLPDAVSDSWRSYGLVAGVDQPIGRQRIFGDLQVNDVRFQDNEALDYVGWSAAGGIDWETIERLSGSLNVNTARRRASYGALANTDLRQQNLETSQRLAARARWGGPSLLVIEGGWARGRLSYSAPEYTGAELTQDAVDAGIRWQPSDLLSVGVGVRRTSGDYTNADASFDRRDLDFTVRWVASGHSVLDARLSRSRQEGDGSITTRDIDGATGALTWRWKPTGKLGFVTAFSRDTGSETSFLRLVNLPDPLAVGDFSRLTKALTFGATWDATAKIRLNASLREERRDLVSTAALAPGVPAQRGNDRLRYARVSVDWLPTLHWKLGCGASREVRREEGGLSTAYAANLASCSAQYTIR